MTEQAGSSLTTTDRLLQTVTALALLLTPVAVAVIGYRATSSSTSKDYVSLAVSILNAKDSPKESREWATAVLNKLSPVPVPNQLKTQLGTGSELVGTKTVQVSVPVAVGCLTAKQYDYWHSKRPPEFDVLTKNVKRHSLTDDQFIKLLEDHAAKLETWSKGADSILKICSDYTAKSDQILADAKGAPGAAK